jgi:hypothetical protein
MHDERGWHHGRALREDERLQKEMEQSGKNLKRREEIEESKVDVEVEAMEKYRKCCRRIIQSRVLRV